jgi:hypothetical protein
MRMGDLFTPAGTGPGDYRGERCRVCEDVVPAEDRRVHVALHEAQGVIVVLGGPAEDPHFAAVADAAAALADYNSRHRPPEHRASDVVHVLHHGQPLCGFHRGVPRDWPDGHWWVANADREEATCTTCVDAHASLSGEVEL